MRYSAIGAAERGRPTSNAQRPTSTRIIGRLTLNVGCWAFGEFNLQHSSRKGDDLEIVDALSKLRKI